MVNSVCDFTYYIEGYYYWISYLSTRLPDEVQNSTHFQ